MVNFGIRALQGPPKELSYCRASKGSSARRLTAFDSFFGVKKKFTAIGRQRQIVFNEALRRAVVWAN